MECTVNRVGDITYDQISRSGHDQRPADLELFAGLGLAALRYPILWERTAPDGLERADWRFADQRLPRLRELGIRPIVGLLHHGSGPPSTSLVDRDLPAQLAAYAGAVARRFPWVDAYTPVNEPLTTARFSGLYGLWYPHGRDASTFARALVVQCRAIVLAMRAIRVVNPRAALVQTEDLGQTHAVPTLAYQAAFENERRWLTFDLLCGDLDRSYPLWGYLVDAGVSERELAWFQDNPCPPECVGLNHYVTSERFLDDDLAAYPDRPIGGNGRHRYVDIEAVRGCPAQVEGFTSILLQAWRRYHRPLALTEVHIGCTREEQLRWLLEAWDGAERAAAAGADVQAVTAWALLGSYDWDSLVTRAAGTYEPGAFDLRGPVPRPTELAAALRELAAGRRPRHPAIEGLGWWRAAGGHPAKLARAS
jgi:dTDP-4-dehydrorhamnose reductase